MLVNECATLPSVTVTPETILSDAAALMRDKGIRRLPIVTETGDLVGIVTERDLQGAARHYSTAPVEVREFMRKPVLTTTLESHVQEAAKIMMNSKIGGLPVVDSRAKIVGVVTETDIFKAFIEILDRTDAG